MRIRTAAADEWSAALEFALGRLDDSVRSSRVLDCLALLGSGEIDPDGIFVAHGAVTRAAGAGASGNTVHDSLRGVLVSIPLPGASGLFWTPQTVPHDPDLEVELTQAALAWLRQRGAKLAQAILSPVDAPFAKPFLRCGFQLVSRLQYLEHSLDFIPASPSRTIRYITYSEGNRDRFHATLLRTYEGTLDCPEVNGLRTIDEIIAGHKGQGRHRPDLWWLGLEDDKPVGVAMVAEAPDLDAWDLSYLGIVPEARRRGLGREITCHVLHAARAASAPRLILAVDERNTPARQLYHGLGFLSADSREVYLKALQRPLAAHDAPSAIRE